MQGSLGQPVIVENVGGAAGSIGTGRVAHARPDGYTIVLGNSGTHVMNGAFYSLAYDVSNDFAPVSPLVTTPLVLFARKTMPAKDLQELIDWLKANPGKASAGFAAVSFQVINLFFQRETGTRFALIPYRGTAPGMQDLAAGQIDLYFTTPLQLPLVRAGSIKAYAVTSDTRLALAPDIPTFAELGLPSLSFSNWYGLFAPKGTPQGYHRQTRCRGRGCAGRSGGANHGSLISAMIFFHASNRLRRRSAPCKRPMRRNGGRSSRRRTSGVNEHAASLLN